MSSCNYNCDEDLGTYNENDCQAEIPGGSNQALFLECGHTITDPSSYSQVNANILSGHAKLISGASFDIPAASPNKQASKVPCRTDSLLNYTRTLNYYNQNISQDNTTFHNTLFSGYKLAGVIIYECGAETPQVTWINSALIFTGNRVLPATIDEPQYYGGTAEWKDIDDPLIYDAPPGIFTT
jgi:hypothetical protein